MAEAKLEVKIGDVSFTGEGSEKWVSDQLKMVLDALPNLADAKPAEHHEDTHTARTAKPVSLPPLASSDTML